MSVMLILILFSISTALIFLGAFIWAVRTGQFEDDYTPSVRILLDEPETEITTTTTTTIEHPSLNNQTHATGKV